MHFERLRTGLNGVINITFAIISLLALASLVAQYGFYIPQSWKQWLNRLDLIIVFYFVIQLILKVILAHHRLGYLRKHWFESLLAVLILSHMAVVVKSLGIDLIKEYFFNLDVAAVTKLTVVIAQVFIITSIISASLRLNRRIAYLKFHPAQTMLFSFLIVIIAGMFLLKLPKAVMPGNDLSWLEALFTSTSATCVTGLIVVDTGSHFSLMGRLIILGLFQIGGLGIMTLSSFLAMFFGRGIAIKERVLLQEMLNIDRLGIIKHTLRNIVLLTFFFEAAGALILYFHMDGSGWGIGERLLQAVFHSVSAFCNAGFSLNADSIMGFASNYWVVFTIAFLIIIGGLGFLVLIELGGGRLLNKKKSNVHKLWSLQTRLIIIVSLILWIGGTLMLFILEPFEGSVFQRFVQAFFSSVTARTAGFTTIDFGLIGVPSALLIIVLMFIGASPGSTAGGIKTTTIGVLSASVFSIIRGRFRIEMFKKTISPILLNRAMVLFAFSIMVICTAVFILAISEQASLLDILFETVSAFGTVGLSRGLTPHLSPIGKTVIIIVMFIGRVGALTLAFAVTAPSGQARVEYPTEKSIMIG